MSNYALLAGQYRIADLPADMQRFAPADFERRYWDLVEYDDADDLAAYISGQRPFIDEHRCARCGRPCKPRYVHCYRCFAYLRVRARTAREGD